jgi:ornithine carbamoyltransferase
MIMKNLFSIQSLSQEQISDIVERAAIMKLERGCHSSYPLAGQIWALLFSRSSTRTRISFETGIRELGGGVLFLATSDLQLGRGEPIRDTARVFGRMVHGVVIRTPRQEEVEEFAKFSGLPTLNALTDTEHPCQILSDLFTIQESFGSLRGLCVCFVGDGNCNVACSWIWAATRLKFPLHIAAPPPYQPAAAVRHLVDPSIVSITDDPCMAARGANVLYTDVWVSMGKEKEIDSRSVQLEGYQINQKTLSKALPGALVMHCLPAHRGKEITEEIFEAHSETIFRQAENRLHTQKAILEWAVQNS